MWFLEGLAKSPDSGADADAHLLRDFTPLSAGRPQSSDLAGILVLFRTPKANTPGDCVAEPGTNALLNERPLEFAHRPNDLKH